MSYEAVRKGSVGARLRFLLRDSAVYGGAFGVSKVFTLLLVPLLTRLLTPGEYAAADVLAIASSVAVMVAALGQDAALARFFYDTEDAAERRQVVAQSFAAQLACAVTVAALLWTGAPAVAATLLGDGDRAGLVRIMAAAVPLIVVQRATQSLMKWTFARGRFVIVSIGYPVVVVGLTVAAVAGLGLGLEGVFYAQLGGAAAAAAAGTWFARGWLGAPRDGRYLRALLRFGVPFLVTGMLMSGMPLVDRYAVTRLLGLDALGPYAVGAKLALLLSLPVLAFQVAWSPMTYAIYREPDARETFDRVLFWVAAGLSLLAAGAAVAAAPVITWVAGREYAAGAAVVLPLAFAVVVEAVGSVAGTGVFFSKRTELGALSYAVGVAVTAAAVAVLVPRYGIVGAGYGALAGKLAQACTYVALAFRAWPLRMSLAPPALAVGAAFALSLALSRAPWTAGVAVVAAAGAALAARLRAPGARLRLGAAEPRAGES